MKISTYNFLIFSDIGFMEVISLVKDSRPSRKINLPVFKNRSSGYTTELKYFSVREVSGPFSLKIFFMELGRDLSELAGLIAKSLPKILLSSILLAALIAAVCLTVFNISQDTEIEATVEGSSVVGLRLTMTIVPIVGLLIAILVFKKKFILTDEKIVEISAQIQERRGNA